MKKNGSSGSVISARKSVTDSDVSNLVLKQSNGGILESLEKINEPLVLEKK